MFPVLRCLFISVSSCRCWFWYVSCIEMLFLLFPYVDVNSKVYVSYIEMFIYFGFLMQMWIPNDMFPALRCLLCWFPHADVGSNMVPALRCYSFCFLMQRLILKNWFSAWRCCSIYSLVQTVISNLVLADIDLKLCFLLWDGDFKTFIMFSAWPCLV
jgi:hypothetical protein